MNTTWWSYFVILLGSIFALLYKYSIRNFDYWKKRNVNFIKPYPFFGNILPLFALKMHMSEWLWNFCGKFKDDYFGMFVFNQPVLIVKSPKLVKAILTKEFTHFEDRSAVVNPKDPIMAEFMSAKKNPEWKLVRSKLTPIFTPGKMKAMSHLILEESNEMIDYLKKHTNVPNVDAKEIAAKYTTNVIAKCAFGLDAGSFRDENAQLRNITRQMFGFSLNTALRQYASFLIPGLVTLFSIDFFDPKIVNTLKRIFFEVLNLKKSRNVMGGDFIDLMLEANKAHDGKYFTDDAMVGQAIMFLTGGFETAASIISFILYELALQSELQERLRNEILDTIEKENGVTYSTIQEMKYLDMVVCETFRKYPSLSFIDRICTTNYKMEDSNLVVEKGTPVYIPMFGLHYNPEYFPDPHRFDPERFADKSKINNDGIYYAPFGAGPRICIGERFGLLGVKIGITQIISKFRVEKSPRTPYPMEFDLKSFLLQSKDGIPLTFVPL